MSTEPRRPTKASAPLPRRIQPGPALHLLLFLTGAFAGLTWLKTFGWFTVAGAAIAATALHATTMPELRLCRSRLLRPLARVADASLHLFWLYCTIAFGSMLAWAVPGWFRIVLAVLAAAAILDRLRGPRTRLPIALPMGLWISACLLGWVNEDGQVHCDDHLRIQRNGALRTVVPSHPDLATCSPGETFRLHRYPRTLWEYPDGQHLLFTTQVGLTAATEQAPEAQVAFTGSICETPTTGNGPIRCVGTGKAEGIVESERNDIVYVAEWMSTHRDKGGTVFALSRTAPLTVVDTLELDRKSINLVYDPTDDMLAVFFDDIDGALMVRATGLEPGRIEPAPFLPADTHFDATRRQGLLCYAPALVAPFDGGAGAAVAFEMGPFHARRLVPSERYPWAWGAMVWGCNFDPAGRTAWVQLANAGLLLTVDFDTGRLRDWHWLGFGARKTVHDPARRRLYIADFLRGDVIIWDLARNEEVRRIFAGRFLRGLALSRDGRTLYTGSSAGVLALPLDAPGSAMAPAP